MKNQTKMTDTLKIAIITGVTAIILKLIKNKEKEKTKINQPKIKENV